VPEPRNQGGTLVRSKLSFDSEFTQIPNAYLRADNTSFKAKGILAHLLSHAPGYRVSLRSLSEVSDRDGLAAVRSGVEELEVAGYLSREGKRSNGTGEYGTVWLLKEPTVPLIEAVRKSHANGGPAFDNRMPKPFDNRTHREHQPRIDPSSRVSHRGPGMRCSLGEHTPDLAAGGRYCVYCAASLDPEQVESTP